MNFYPFHIGDYAAHTRNLSLLEDLAYRRLLDAYYLAERPLTGSATDVAREIGMREQADAVEYVLGRFFIREGEAWRQPRVDQEIERYQAKQEQASRAGKASAAKRSNGKPTPVKEEGNGRSTNQEPRTKNQSKEPPLPPEGDGFAEFWSAYPLKKAKATAEKAWQKLKPSADLQAAILSAIAAHKLSADWQRDGGQYIPHPTTWLNQRRWEDEVKPAGTVHAFPGQSRHTGFADRDYTEGLIEREDGTYAF